MDQYAETEGEDSSSDYGYDEYEEQQSHDALYKKLTDFDPYLAVLIMEWLGRYWDSNKETYVRDPRVPPKMNVIGARWCVTFLRTYARDNNIMTRVTDKTFRFMMTDIVRTVWLNIGTRAEEFAIKKNGDIMAICHQLIHSAELVLVGAHGNKTYMDDISGSYGFREGGQVAAVPTQQPQRKGIIGGFKNFIGLK